MLIRLNSFMYQLDILIDLQSIDIFYTFKKLL